MNPKAMTNARDASDAETADELLADLKSLIDASRRNRRPAEVETIVEQERQETIEWDGGASDADDVAAPSAEDLIAPELLFSDQDESDR